MAVVSSTFSPTITNCAFRCLPERTKMIIFNTVAVTFPSIAYASVGFLTEPIHTVIMFTSIYMCFSTAGGGFYKCGALCARQYTHFIIANIQFVKCLTLFMGPALMALLVSDETDRTQWRRIFLLLSAALFLVGG